MIINKTDFPYNSTDYTIFCWFKGSKKHLIALAVLGFFFYLHKIIQYLLKAGSRGDTDIIFNLFFKNAFNSSEVLLINCNKLKIKWIIKGLIIFKYYDLI
jgi:hypothetical protein